MKKTTFTIAFLLVLAMLFLPVLAFAQIVMGTSQGVRAPFCLTAEAAVMVAKADSEGGPAAAMTVLKASGQCGFAEGVVTPKSVLFSAKTERGATVRVLEVVVDLGDGRHATAFMLSDTEVVGLKITQRTQEATHG